MAKPFIHALSSAKRWGGKPEDYIEIHNLMDSSKGAIADHRHRALTHNAWFVSVIIEKVFGITLTNSAGKQISTREVAEYHVLEDFKNRFIPTAQDFLQEMEMKPWMDNGKETPPSFKRLDKPKKDKKCFKNDFTKVLENSTNTLLESTMFFDGAKNKNFTAD